MELTLSAYRLKFIILLAILTPAGAMSCPSSCSCTGGATGSSLTVDCHRYHGINSTQLSQQIDSQLSSNLSHGRLTRLTITGTPLTLVPSSVCRLTTLTLLHLDHNQLTRLPDQPHLSDDHYRFQQQYHPAAGWTL